MFFIFQTYYCNLSLKSPLVLIPLSLDISKTTKTFPNAMNFPTTDQKNNQKQKYPHNNNKNSNSSHHNPLPKYSNVYIKHKLITILQQQNHNPMLAPSHRQHTKRERGISLSRTSSHQKIQHSVIKQMRECMNQSFQCIEPVCGFGRETSNLGSESVLKERSQNRLSVIPDKYQSCRDEKPHMQSHRRKGSTLRSKQQSLTQSSFHLGHSVEAQSIHQMIDLLVEYQKECQREMDLQSAEQARKRINQLKIEQIKTKRKQLEVEGKEYVIKTRRQGQVEKREFYEFWDGKILEARQALKQIQQKHLQQQRKQFIQHEKAINQQPDATIKYSSKVLQTRRNLTSLIKSRKYKQAEHLKLLLAKREAEQQQKWTIACQQKKQLKLKEFRKKQHIQLEAFKLKLNSSFNELIKEKEKQQERMIKKMKKMEVQAGKVPTAIVRAKKDLLNQSKANIENEESWY